MSSCCEYATDQELDPLSPELVDVQELAKSLPHTPSRQVVWRWTAKGVHGIKLRSVRIGRRSYSTPDEFRAFLIATQRAAAE